MKAEVFQLQNAGSKVELVKIGDIVSSGKIDPEMAWHLANWSCWYNLGDRSSQPKIVEYDENGIHYTYTRYNDDHGVANHDIAVKIRKFYYTKSFGWGIANSFEEAKEELMKINKEHSFLFDR